MRELQALKNSKWLRHAAGVALTSLVAGTFFAILGPFGTDRMGWPAVWIAWIGLMFAGFVFAGGAVALVDRVRPGAPWWLWIAAVAILISVPMTLLLLALEGAANSSFSLASFPVKFLHVAVISLALVGFAYLAERPSVEPVSPPVAAGPPAFLKRIPARLAGGDLYALSAEDHYLRIHTSRGDDLILMRLGDAIGELHGIEGLRVHRSWWVARSGVDRVKRDGEKPILVLRNGTEAPIARANIRTLKTAGWI